MSGRDFDSATNAAYPIPRDAPMYATVGREVVGAEVDVEAIVCGRLGLQQEDITKTEAQAKRSW